MIYKFKSKATGDVLMLGPNGDELLRIWGREPAPQGIVEVGDMPAAIAAIDRAISDEQAEHARLRDEAVAEGHAPVTPQGISLQQRLWPMREMLQRAQAEGEPVVWGV